MHDKPVIFHPLMHLDLPHQACHMQKFHPRSMSTVHTAAAHREPFEVACCTQYSSNTAQWLRILGKTPVDAVRPARLPVEQKVAQLCRVLGVC
jgi:hypothetical protein